MRLIVTNEAYKASGGWDCPEPQPLAQLHSARGEKPAFQIVLRTGERCLINPGDCPALTADTGLARYRISVSAPFACSLFPIGYLPDETGVPRADVLLTAPAEYDALTPACVYAELNLPPDAAPGDYEVTVRAFLSRGARGEEEAASCRLTLTVADYVMPSPRDYRLYLDLWQQSSNVARTYKTELWSDAHFAELKNVTAALADLGQKSVTVLAGDCPWRGWGCYLLRSTPAVLYEYSMVRTVKENGSFRYDYSAMDRYIGLCAAAGIDGDITVYGLMGIWTNMPLFPCDAPEDYPEPVLIRYYDADSGCYGYLKRTEDILSYVKALFGHFKETGVFDRVRIGADEPRDLEAYRKNVELLRSAAPNVRFKMALDSDEAIERFAPDTDDIAASFPCVCRSGKQLIKLKNASGGAADNVSARKRLLWYVCNIPDRPNTVLKSDLLESRALFAMAYLFGFDGFLRWAFTCWTDEPRRDIRYNSSALPAGDVALVYPAEDGSLLFSLRYKALKRGIEDYELLSRLAEADPEAAKSAVSSVLYNLNPQTYMRTDRTTAPDLFSVRYDDYAAMRARVVDALIDKEKSL